MKVFFVLLVAALCMPLTIFGQHATVREWYRVLDSTLSWGSLGLPMRDIPTGLSDSSVRRAYELGIAMRGGSEASYEVPFTYEEMGSTLIELSFPDLYGWDGVKERLRAFGMSFDSLEAALRGIDDPFFTVPYYDTVSSASVAHFASRGASYPVIFIPSIETTLDDTLATTVEVRKFRLGALGAFSTEFYSNETAFEVTDVEGQHNLATVWYPSNNVVAGIARADSAPIGTSITVARISLVPRSVGMGWMRTRNSVVVDTLGLTNTSAWSMKSFFGSFSKYDVNQDFLETIADAVYASRLLLRDIPPPSSRSGDINGNGTLDPDDVWLIFTHVVGGGARALPVPASITTEPARGTLIVAVADYGDEVGVQLSFEGTVGESKRCAIEFSLSPSLAFESARLLTSVIEPISGFESKPGLVRMLVYPQPFVSGVLAEFRFSRQPVDSAWVRVAPIGENFLSSQEDVTVVYHSELVQADGSGKTPRSFSLLQNYPNPFNPGTEIRFSIERDGPVTLTVSDVLGNEVARTVRVFSAGEHTFYFEGKDVPSGVYFYRLDANGVSATKKMLLVR